MRSIGEKHRGWGCSLLRNKKTPRRVAPGRRPTMRLWPDREPLPLLGRFRGRRRRRLWRCGAGRRGLGWRRGCRRRATLYRVRGVVELHDVLGYVDIGGGKKNRRVLRRSIQDGHVAILARVAVQHIDHLAADAIEHFRLRRVYVFLVFVLFPLELPRQLFAFALQTRFLFIAELTAAGVHALAQIVDLLVQPFQLALARRKLRLQFRAGLLALGRAGNRLAHIDDAELRAGGRTRRGALRAQPAGA